MIIPFYHKRLLFVRIISQMINELKHHYIIIIQLASSVNILVLIDKMSKMINSGDCVRIPDGRIARVRDISKNKYRIRVRRKNNKNHQFLKFAKGELTKVECPKGWMSPDGYNRYLKETLAKMKKRMK